EQHRRPPPALEVDERPHAARAVVSEEVEAEHRRDFLPAVYVAAADRAVAAGMRILRDRLDVAREAAAAICMRSLEDRPAIVLAALARARPDVDLLQCVLADVADVQRTGGAVEAEAPWIAQAVGPDLAPRCRGEARVGRRDRVRAGGADVDPK